MEEKEEKKQWKFFSRRKSKIMFLYQTNLLIIVIVTGVSTYSVHMTHVQSRTTCPTIISSSSNSQSCIEWIESAIDIMTMRLLINSCLIIFVLPSSGILFAKYRWTLYVVFLSAIANWPFFWNLSPNLKSFLVFICKFVICKPNFLVPIYRL